MHSNKDAAEGVCARGDYRSTAIHDPSRRLSWPFLPLFAKQNSAMLKPSQNETKTAAKQDATPVSEAKPSPSPSPAQGALTGSRFASDIPKTTTPEK